MLRLANQDDLPFLKLMLYEACHTKGVPPSEEELKDPKVSGYLDGWIRTGDCGLISVSDSGDLQGAAWYRLFRADAPGYGFADEQTPELVIAVVPDARGKGTGSRLLAGLKNVARAQGHEKLSLSVEPGNLRARLLYAKVGFREISASEETLVMTVALPPKRSRL